MAIKVDIATVVQTTRRYKIEITGDDIRELLSRNGTHVPSNAKIEFTVPGGADWSNTSIDIDEKTPITVEWEFTDTESSK